jgi:hypothetical protein
VWPHGKNSHSFSNTTTKEQDTDIRQTFWWSGERFALIGELLAQHGYIFRVWRRSEIVAEPRLTNSNVMLRYRCVAVSAAEQEGIRRAFSSTLALPLRTLCHISRAPVQSVLRLVLDGTLHIDWWKPLSLESNVGIVPIGRQIWPCAVPGFPQNLSEEARCH